MASHLTSGEIVNVGAASGMGVALPLELWSGAGMYGDPGVDGAGSAKGRSVTQPPVGAGKTFALLSVAPGAGIGTGTLTEIPGRLTGDAMTVFPDGAVGAGGDVMMGLACENPPTRGSGAGGEGGGFTTSEASESVLMAGFGAALTMGAVRIAEAGAGFGAGAGAIRIAGAGAGFGAGAGAIKFESESVMAGLGAALNIAVGAAAGAAAVGNLIDSAPISWATC
jgi:hypothetical protein